MMTEEQATHLGKEWVAAWNSHDISTIMAHYAEDILFTSPFIIKINNDPSGTISGKAALQAYFERALKAYPELHFELWETLASVNSIIVYYKSVNNLHAAEFMELDAAGKVCRVYAHYTN